MPVSEIDAHIKLLERAEYVRTHDDTLAVHFTVSGHHDRLQAFYEFEKKIEPMIKEGRFCYPYRKNGVAGYWTESPDSK